MMSTLSLAGGQLMTHLFSLLHLVHLAARSAPSDKAYGTTSAPKQHVIYEMVWKSLCLERCAWQRAKVSQGEAINGACHVLLIGSIRCCQCQSGWN